MGSGEDVGDLAAGEWRRSWRRRWRLGGWRVETTLESQRLGSEEDNGNVAGGGVETKQET